MTVLAETQETLSTEQLQSPLGQLALRLAAAVDEAAPMALSALSRELRLTLAELKAAEPADSSVADKLAALSKPS